MLRYETANHLWLVVELCTGGSLARLMELDGPLPESSVRSFGVQLVAGLRHLHATRTLLCDLNPRGVLLDADDSRVCSSFFLTLSLF